MPIHFPASRLHFLACLSDWARKNIAYIQPRAESGLFRQMIYPCELSIRKPRSNAIWDSRRARLPCRCLANLASIRNVPGVCRGGVISALFCNHFEKLSSCSLIAEVMKQRETLLLFSFTATVAMVNKTWIIITQSEGNENFPANELTSCANDERRRWALIFHRGGGIFTHNVHVKRR